MGMEMQPLRPGRTTGNLRLQTEESQHVDQSLRGILKSAKREYKVVILGTKSRKRVFEEMKLSSGHPQCYTTEQLYMSRPMILGTFFECVQCLAKKLLASEATRGDTIRACLDQVLMYDKEDLDLHNGFQPRVVQILRTIMEFPAAKALVEGEAFLFSENFGYFLDQMERILQDEYITTESDAINCKTPLPTEAVFQVGSKLSPITARLTDPGYGIVRSTKELSHLEAASAMIYVFDLNIFSGKALAHFESLANSHWLRKSSIIVILNNFKGFTKRLTEEPLSDEFPDYAGGDDEKNASKYIRSKIKALYGSDNPLYTYVANGVYDDGNVKIWRYIKLSIWYRSFRESPVGDLFSEQGSSIPKQLHEG